VDPVSAHAAHEGDVDTCESCGAAAELYDGVCAACEPLEDTFDEDLERARRFEAEPVAEDAHLDAAYEERFMSDIDIDGGWD
jgi:predicted ATP-dependent serine protease